MFFRALRFAGQNILILCITLAGLEILLQLFLPAPSLGFSQPFRQNIAGLKNNFVYDRNDWGLRSRSMKTLNKPANTIRIIVLGASTTDQATQATDDTWSGILEKKMTQHFASKNLSVEVAAYGRGGDTIYDTYCWAKDNLESMQPDLVIVLQGINDMAWNGGHDYSFDKNHPPKCSGFMTHFLRHNSEVFRWSIHLKNLWRVKKNLASGGAIEWHSENLAKIRKEFAGLPAEKTITRDPDPLLEYESGLTKLRDYILSLNARALFLSQPSVWQKEMPQETVESLWFHINTKDGKKRLATEWLEIEMQRYNAITRKISEVKDQKTVSFFDLAASIPKTRAYFFDDCHFTDRGSELVAEMLVKSVSDLW